MRDSIFTGKIPITCPNEDIPWQMKCDVVKTEEGIEIRLIDTRDIFTFYLCRINESDFYILKREQDIMVDFDRFISILVKLFHNILTEKIVGMFSKESNKFLFVERDEFRNIVRLELKFQRPDENHYKIYLGDIIGRMESDNIKLIKENGMLREKVRSNEKEVNGRIKYLEEELLNSKKKIERLYKENESLVNSEKIKSHEIDDLSKKLYNIEAENVKINFEVEKLRLQETKNLNLAQRLQELEETKNNLTKELSTANEIIKKYTDEVGEMKAANSTNEVSLKELRNENKKYKSELEEGKERIKQLEDKNKKIKEDNKNKEVKIKEMSIKLSDYTKRLENAQNVYNHFYSQNVRNSAPRDNFSDTESMFSIHPESPPHQ